MTQPISIETLKDGSQVSIYHSDFVAMTPVYTFFLRQMADVIDAGYGSAFTTWEDKNIGAVYAEQDEKIVGILVYDTQNQAQGFFWSLLGSVVESVRGKGLYTIIQRNAENIAKERGCKFFASRVHKDNTARLVGAEKSGMSPVFYHVIKDIR